MNRTTFLMLMILTLLLTACAGNTPNTTQSPSGTQGRPPTGGLSASMQVAIGTIKLDQTGDAVTAEQAKELLPLWETLQVLYGSDTAATEEIDALVQQIQDTMTDQQTQAITALNLTRQDMFSIMQSQGPAFGAGQNGNAQSGNSSNTNGRNFGGGDGLQGPPPDGGGFPGGGPGFQGQGSTRTQNSDSGTATSARAAIDPNRIPTPLVQAVIEYLKKKAGA